MSEPQQQQPQQLQPPEPSRAAGLSVALAVVLLAAASMLVMKIARGGEAKAPPPPKADSGAPWTEVELALMQSLSPPPELPPSPTNAVADDPKAATLGQRLFFDTRLSGDGTVSCASCHVPSLYFTDGRRFGLGLDETGRHVPTVIGAQWQPFLFWDGRADSVWAQALGPLEAENEHGMTRLSVARAVYTHHRAEYEALFGAMPAMGDLERFPEEARPVPMDSYHLHSQRWEAMSAADRKAINAVFANVGKALEAYQRKLVPGVAPFDRYVAAVRGGDADGGGHLSTSAQRGLRAFIGEAQCINCHNGPLLTDMTFHNLGLPRPPEAVGKPDLGRTLGAVEVLGSAFNCQGEFSDAAERCDELTYLNPRFEDFRGAFKTPTLRNVSETGPYMHDGRFGTLEEVLAFYKSLPGEPEIGHRELVLELLDPDVSSADLVAFLESLTGPLPDARWLGPPTE